MTSAATQARRPNPPPSPGGSDRRARLTQEDRHRIDERVRYAKGGEKKPEIRHRWIEGEAEFGLRQDGHYVVLRYRDLQPGAPVLVYIPDLPEPRPGRLRALVPGWGSRLPVMAYVEFPPPQSREDPELFGIPVVSNYPVDWLQEEQQSDARQVERAAR